MQKTVTEWEANWRNSGRYSLQTLEGKQMKQIINCARLKRYLDPPGEDQMLPTDDNAQDGRNYGINDTCHSASNSVHVGEEGIDEAKDDSEHLNKDNEKQENERMTSINPGHYEKNQDKLDCSLLEQQLYSTHLLRLWRSGACALKNESNEDDEQFNVSF